MVKEQKNNCKQTMHATKLWKVTNQKTNANIEISVSNLRKWQNANHIRRSKAFTYDR